MQFNICCCCLTKTEPKSSSPNVIDVYIPPKKPFQSPILTQPHRLKINSKPVRPLSDNLVHDLKKYENDPKGFNNFAFVDEIDDGIKSKLPKKTLNETKVNVNGKDPSAGDIGAQETLKEIATNENQINVIEQPSKLLTENYTNLKSSSSSYSIHPENNVCVVTTIRDGHKMVQTFNIENNQQITNEIHRSAEKMAKSIRDALTPFVDIVENRMEINDYDDEIINRGRKRRFIDESHGIGTTNFMQQTDNDFIVNNSFHKFIEDSRLMPHLDEIYQVIPTEQYATIKYHEDHLMKADIFERKIPKRKFPNAFDKKMEKSNDLKRKPKTNLIISKVELLKEIPSDYRYANFRLASLDAHNVFRAKHGCQPLIESLQLNQIAQDWAYHLAVNNYEIYHRPNNQFGENLYWTNNSFGNAGMAVRAWYDEIEFYDYDKPEFSQQTGHFTQLLWKTTTELGTAIAKIGNDIWVVCNYNPPGNVMGQFNDEFVPRLLK